MPVLVLAGVGPMDTTRRRPQVDWVHTSNGLGGVVRDFTKWEQQPASVAAIPEAMLRAWHLASTEPGGPVLLSLDVGLQEQRVEEPSTLPTLERYPLPVPIDPPAESIEATARWLVDAEFPVILVGRVAPQQTAGQYAAERLAPGDEYERAIVSRIPSAWPAGVWEFIRPGSHLGNDGGGGLGSGPGMAVGAGLAARGSGRAVVAFLGDGDTRMAPTPHQERVARTRGRPVENRVVGQRMALVDVRVG